MKIIDARLRLDQFLVNHIPLGVVIQHLPDSGVGDYSLIGKKIGEENWKFLCWSGIYQKKEPICEVIHPDIVRLIDSSIIQQLAPFIEEFEKESGRVITVVKKNEWQRFTH